jgi:photosystem II stability/assembly factor-like uncharacterized protein
MKFKAGRTGFVALLSLLFALPACAVSWFPLGPYGGDARSIAVDPHDTKHLYLGTATGWIYDSRDGGTTWQRISQINNRNDLVIARIVADPQKPKRLIVAAWFVDRPDGGLYISDDGGKSWYSQSEMRGQSVRSLARSLSDPSILVAGSLHGVFQSKDDGVHWHQISPEGSTEIHEVESIAIDPVDPKIIYAGTWHLPWKTTDDGAHWVNIKEGIIDDSDVFSIIVDPKNPAIVYASACSGIYKSVSGANPNPHEDGHRFQKVKGIPNTARRTRKLLQDPNHPQTVYAGTTEGLYRTTNGGEAWSLLTGGEVIVNDVFVDPNNSSHVLLATDRGGVLRSEDGGMSFEGSNEGFSSRQVSAYAADPEHPSTVYVGVVNDKTTGGVFQSRNGGISWQQESDGLGGLDVFSLTTNASGVLLAGTNRGIYRLEDGVWLDSSSMPAPEVAKPTAPVAPHKKAVKKRTVLGFSMRGAVFMARMQTIAYESGSKTSASKGVKKKHPAVTAKKALRHTVVKKPVPHKAVVKQASVVEDDSAVPTLAPAHSGETVASVGAASIDTSASSTAVASTVARSAEPSTATSAAAVTTVRATPKAELLHTEKAKIVTPQPPVIKPVLRLGKVPPPSAVRTPPVSSAAIGVVGPPITPARAAESVAPSSPTESATLVAPAPRPAPRPSAPPLAKPVSGPRLNAVVYSLVPADAAIYAGTSVGLMQGDAEGRVWQPVKGVPVENARYIAVQGPMVFVASLKSLALSSDGGHTWAPVPSPPELTQIASVAVDELKTLWVGGRQGLYYSIDSGLSWKQLQNMYMQQVDGVYFDKKLDRILVTTAESPILFIAQLPDYRVSYWDTGWKLRFARPVGDHLLGATLYDGMVVQPEMVDSAVGKTALTGGK